MLKDDVRLDILLDKLTEAAGRVSRLEAVRNDDAGFDEAKHPRDKDGKFAKGAGAVGSYQKTLKPGKKGTASGLIKHLLMGGQHSVEDIFDLAKEHYGAGSGGNVNGKSYVNYYANELKKAGEKVPPPPAVSKGGDEAESPEPQEEDDFDFSGLGNFKKNDYSKKYLLAIAEDPSEPVTGKIADISHELSKLQDDSNIEYGKKLLAILTGVKAPEASEKKAPEVEAAKEEPPGEPPPAPSGSPFGLAIHPKFPKAADNYIKPLLDNWDKVLPENNKDISETISKVETALGSADPKKAIAEIQDLQGGGLVKNSFNQVLGAVKKSLGVKGSTPSTPAYAPTTKIEKDVYAATKAVAPYRADSTSYLEDATGKEVKSRLQVNTKNIPGDFYAKVSSAYGADSSSGNTSAVGSAMQEYRYHIWGKLAQDEKAVMDFYKGVGYRPINAALLDGLKDDQISSANKQKIKLIRKVIGDNVVPANTPVFRGMKATLKDLSGFEDAEHSIGRCFEHKNFASVSRDKNVAKKFGEDIMLQFTIPAGTPGFVLGGQEYSENEIVLSDKSVFRIDKVEKKPHPHVSGKTQHHLHVTYMGVRQDDE